MTAAAGALLVASGITKRFGSVVANDSVDFAAFAGEIHALLGENGAGKTTLCEVLAGTYQPERGWVSVAGRRISLGSPAEALTAGIGMVHQHFRLVPTLTVAENIALGAERLPLRLRRRQLAQATAVAAAHLGWGIEPQALVGELSISEQQRVEIVRLLARDVQVLILDEPTAVLAPPEVDTLFDALRHLAERGRAVVIVTHKLREVTALADRVTVMRGGRVVDTVSERVDSRRLAELMVGYVPVPPARTRRATDEADVVLRLRGVTVDSAGRRSRLKDVSLDVRTGEIVGVLGVGGSGQRELAEVIGGLRKPDEGRTELAGRVIDGTGPRERVVLGISFVPEDRRSTGLAGMMTVAENLVLRNVGGPFARGPVLNRSAIARNARGAVERFEIRGCDVTSLVSSLSGGNQQKVVLARELAGEPGLIVAASPTRGLDIAASRFVEQHLLAERDRGAAIILVTEDIEQALRLCDRVAVLHAGRIAETMAVEDADTARIGQLMAGFDVAS
jgi:simple sugar transport system ATP-binding protein